MLNPAADTHGLDQLRQIDAFGYAFKLDGQLMRDAACVIGPGAVQPGDDTPLSNDALRLSTTDTILASSTRLRPLGNVEFPDPGSDPSGILAMIKEDLKAFTGKGLGAGQFGQAFGPESGFVLNWPAGALLPRPLWCCWMSAIPRWPINLRIRWPAFPLLASALTARTPGILRSTASLPPVLGLLRSAPLSPWRQSARLPDWIPIP